MIHFRPCMKQNLFSLWPKISGFTFVWIRHLYSARAIGIAEDYLGLLSACKWNAYEMPIFQHYFSVWSLISLYVTSIFINIVPSSLFLSRFSTTFSHFSFGPYKASNGVYIGLTRLLFKDWVFYWETAILKHSKPLKTLHSDLANRYT